MAVAVLLDWLLADMELAQLLLVRFVHDKLGTTGTLRAFDQPTNSTS